MKVLGVGSLAVMLIVAALLPGCGKKQSTTDDSIQVTWKTVDVPPGADPSVSAEQGGEGFEKLAESMGYATNAMKAGEEIYFGDPRAVTGGSVTFTSSRYPLSFRPFFFGPNANFTENSHMTSMCYQSLIGTHPVTLDYMPALATHWKIGEDFQTFWFRINPNARFWDGNRVTAEDVVATWKLVMDATILSPSMQQTYGRYEEPVAESMYIVKIVAKERNWRSFLSIGASLPILSAKQIGSLTGKEFVDKFQFEQPIGSGEYIILKEDIKKEQSYAFTRRPDFWAKDDPESKYAGNFDKIKFVTIVDNPTVEYETFKKGESDIFYYTSISIEQWIKDTQDDFVVNNWVKKIRVKTDGAAGAAGIYFNMRKAPFDDIRVRRAFFHLYDREKLISQLLYDEYEPYQSFYAGGMYENASNTNVTYNPELASKLLAEAGWTQRNSDGILTKGGRPLVVEMSIVKPVEKFVTPFQETLKKAGVKLVLKFEDGNAITKNIGERNFSMAWINYGGLTYPNPETSYHSSLADKNDNNNITGFKNTRLDELCESYKLAFTQAERTKIIREVDGILWETCIAALTWNTKGIKLGYWDKFGMPEYVLGRFAQPGDHDLQVMGFWWYDAEKDAALQAARKEGKALSGDNKPREVLYWKQRKF